MAIWLKWISTKPLQRVHLAFGRQWLEQWFLCVKSLGSFTSINPSVFFDLGLLCLTSTESVGPISHKLYKLAEGSSTTKTCDQLPPKHVIGCHQNMWSSTIKTCDRLPPKHVIVYYQNMWSSTTKTCDHLPPKHVIVYHQKMWSAATFCNDKCKWSN